MTENRTDNSVKNAPASKGDGLFDFIVYGPVNFIGTFVLSAALATFHQRKFGGVNDKIVAGLKKIGLGENFSNAFIPTFVISWGGTIMLLPIKWAEDSRLAIVNTFNRWMGDKQVSQEDAAEHPKQTWGSLLEGRIGAWAVVWGSMFAAGKFFGPQFDAMQEKTGSVFARWLKAPTHHGADSLLTQKQTLLETAKAAPLSKEATQQLQTIEKSLVKHESLQFTLGKMMAIDVFATAAAVSLLYAISHGFAKRRDEKALQKESKPPLPEIVATAPTSAPAPQLPLTKISAIEPQGQAVSPQNQQLAHA